MHKEVGKCEARFWCMLQVVQGDQSGREPPLAATSADVWALGAITFEVMSGQHPTTRLQCCHFSTAHPV